MGWNGNLEYLMSSLPYLRWQVATDKQVIDLLAQYASVDTEHADPMQILETEASKYLSAEKSMLFQSIRLEHIHQPIFQLPALGRIAQFSHFDATLRQQIATLRLARRANQQQGANQSLPRIITPGSPLQEEMQLLRLQWDKLEELAIGHYADWDALVVYKLKLMILQRLWSFDSLRGMDVFKRLTSTDSL
ncbi:MAG: DUF2764 family protein [Saprospiraceae bacterium]